VTVTLEGAIPGLGSVPDAGTETALYVLIVPATDDGMPLVLGAFYGSEDEARMRQLEDGSDLVVGRFQFGCEVRRPERTAMDALRAQVARQVDAAAGTDPPINLGAFGS